MYSQGVQYFLQEEREDRSVIAQAAACSLAFTRFVSRTLPSSSSAFTKLGFELTATVRRSVKTTVLD